MKVMKNIILPSLSMAIIKTMKGANDTIIIQGKLVVKSLCMHNHGLHHVLIYTFHSKIQRLMQRLLLTASRSLKV